MLKIFFRTKKKLKKRMLDYWLDTLRCTVFRFNPDIYFRQRACRVSVVSVDVQFFLSDQAIARRHETGNIPLPGVPTLSSFPTLKQTNKTLVSLLSFKVDLMLKSMILVSFPPLASCWDWKVMVKFCSKICRCC